MGQEEKAKAQRAQVTCPQFENRARTLTRFLSRASDLSVGSSSLVGNNAVEVES